MSSSSSAAASRPPARRLLSGQRRHAQQSSVSSFISSDAEVDISSGYVDSRRKDHRPLDGLAYWVASGCALLSAVYTTYLMWSSNPSGLGWFAYHPPLQAGALALFTFALLTLQPTHTSRDKASGLWRHQLLALAAGLPMLLIGTWTIYHNKDLGHRPHLVTWHGTLGMAAVAWVGVQVLVGASTVWFRGALWGGEHKAKALWKFHRISGYLLYAFLVFVFNLGGAWSTFSNSRAGHLMRVLAFSIAPIAMVVAVSLRIRLSKMKLF